MILLARLVRTAGSVIALILVAGIVLVVFEANESNDVVDAVLDAAKFFAGPLDSLIDFKNNDVEVAVNWGIAAVLYVIVAGLIARLLARAGLASFRRRSVP
jgi:hypothetical protein